MMLKMLFEGRKVKIGEEKGRLSKCKNPPGIS